MRIAVITNEDLKLELLAQGIKENTTITWHSRPERVKGADSYIDLLFQDDQKRIVALKKLQPALVVVNEVDHESGLPDNFIRLNGWKSFLQRAVAEVSGGDPATRSAAEMVFACFNKTTRWAPAQPGFISARIISMIINEAYYALGDNVSTRNDIDAAMKLGTNYPYGPFEWSAIIGVKNVYELLIALEKANPDHIPAPLLKNEALIK